MSVPFSNTKLRVPPGFQAVLEDLAKEVLRSQPPDIYAFAALHFGKLLKVRDEGGIDPADQCAQIQDRFYNNTAFDKQEIDANSSEQQLAATTIQTKYRQHHAVNVVQEKREEHAAVKIQSGFRGYQSRTQVKQLRDELEHQDADGTAQLADDKGEEDEIDIDLNGPEVKAAAIKIQDMQDDVEVSKSMAVEEDAMPEPEEEIDIDLTDPEVEKAATKIQAGFKGFKARKEMDALKAEEPVDEPEKIEDEEEVIDIDLNDPEVEKAANKIQAGFKGYKTRKELKESTPEQEVAPQETAAAAKAEEEEIDIDLEDPEVEQAAIKIQAGFKSFKARKSAKDDAAPDETEAAPEMETAPVVADADVAEPKAEVAGDTNQEEEIDIDLDDPEVEKAAFKIQAGFKGFKARKELKEGQENKEATEGNEEETTEGGAKEEGTAEGGAKEEGTAEGGATEEGTAEEGAQDQTGDD